MLGSGRPMARHMRLTLLPSFTETSADMFTILAGTAKNNNIMQHCNHTFDKTSAKKNVGTYVINHLLTKKWWHHQYPEDVFSVLLSFIRMCIFFIIWFNRCVRLNPVHLCNLQAADPSYIHIFCFPQKILMQKCCNDFPGHVVIYILLGCMIL